MTQTATVTPQLPQVVQLDAGQVFSSRPSNKIIYGYSSPWDSTPQLNPNYVYPTWAPDIVIWFLSMTEPLYLFGPTGCGKTTCIKQMAAKLNYPVYEVTGHNRLEFPEMVGHHTVADGSMKYVYGPLALAMKYGGLFLLNEIDLLDPSTAAGLNSVLDGSSLTIPENGGELITPHPMFRFIATANSNGGGDKTGRYQGVLTQNIAFMDRFVLLEADYLDAKTEKAIIMKAQPTLPEPTVDKMLQYANAVRSLFQGKAAEGLDTTLEVTLSTRTVLRWAHLTVQFEPLKQRGLNVVMYALERSLAFRASKATQKSLKELHQRIF